MSFSSFSPHIPPSAPRQALNKLFLLVSIQVLKACMHITPAILGCNWEMQLQVGYVGGRGVLLTIMNPIYEHYHILDSASFCLWPLTIFLFLKKAFCFVLREGSRRKQIKFSFIWELEYLSSCPPVDLSSN